MLLKCDLRVQIDDNTKPATSAKVPILIGIRQKTATETARMRPATPRPPCCRCALSTPGNASIGFSQMFMPERCT